MTETEFAKQVQETKRVSENVTKHQMKVFGIDEQNDPFDYQKCL